MQLVKAERALDLHKIEHLLKEENKFITDLLTLVAIPKRIDPDADEPPGVDHRVNNTKTSRAKSLSELQQRLHLITNRKNLSYKEKLTKKGLKNRLKKKNKRDERNAAAKLKRASIKKVENTGEGKVKLENHPKPTKPVFNQEGKIVYSKFEFPQVTQKKDGKMHKDPKKILYDLKKQDEKIKKLSESGDKHQAVEMKEKAAWKNALAKAEGQKVKDDPTLLKKTLKRQEQKKRSSEKKWKQRQENVKKVKEERQRKRTENIDKRKKDKKVHKLKKAAKKGKIIAGF